MPRPLEPGGTTYRSRGCRAAAVVGVLSLGYDLTQPLLAGVVTQLSINRGQAMGFNVFTLFVGSGVGSLLFQLLLDAGFTTALVVFGAGATLAALAGIPLFAGEGPPAETSPPRPLPTSQ